MKFCITVICVVADSVRFFLLTSRPLLSRKVIELLPPTHRNLFFAFRTVNTVNTIWTILQCIAHVMLTQHLEQLNVERTIREINNNFKLYNVSIVGEGEEKPKVTPQGGGLRLVGCLNV